MKENFHPWVKVDQANRPLPPKTLCILEGLALKKLVSLCSQNLRVCIRLDGLVCF